jgi:hypothetical protein
VCTVTVVPHGAGVRVACNRDERPVRPDAWPPRVHQVGGRWAAFPIDPLGGGTWIGVNDAGLIVTLLNRNGGATDAVLHPKRSRGLIARRLLRCGSADEALRDVATLDVSDYAPFSVLLVHGPRVSVATSDGTALLTTTEPALDRPMLLTSSALGDEVVDPPRRRLFERLVIDGRHGWLNGQAAFHRHRWKRRPDLSVRMSRADALTVSQTTADVTRSGRRLLYQPLGADGHERGREWCSLR